MTKKYNEIEVKDNMKVENEKEEAPKEKEKAQRVVTAQPKKVKKSLIGRLVTGIVGPDGLPGIGAYVNEEIVKPAIKNIIVDAVTSGINMVMYGDKGGPPRRNGNQFPRQQYAPRTNYNDNYRNAPQGAQAGERVVRPVGRGVEDFKLIDRQEASNVLVSLVEYADMYNSVSVADYYDMIGVESKYTDHNIGWTYDTISRATVMAARGGGFIIKFPPTEVI